MRTPSGSAALPIRPAPSICAAPTAPHRITLPSLGQRAPSVAAPYLRLCSQLTRTHTPARAPTHLAARCLLI